MAAEILIPDKAVKYVLFQRTSCLFIPATRPFRVLNRLSKRRFYNTAVAMEALFRRKKVKHLLNEDMQSEYEDIRPSLPDRARNILDIGCGVGAIDVLLYRHFRGRDDVQIYLLDKSRVESRVSYGFHREEIFYGSLDVTRSVLTENGIPTENIHLREATEDHRIDVPGELDLVLSLASWGFHYPVSVYLDRVYSLLRPGGRAIVDIRRGSGGERELRQKFLEVRLISEAEKKIKYLAVK